LPEIYSLKPYRTTIHNWGKCASYEFENHTEDLTKVEIRSPADVTVFLHSKDQLSIPKELSVRTFFNGYHSIEVTVEKTIDLNKERKPCYDNNDHGNESYGEHEFNLLVKKIMEKFNCSTPFIPPEFRKGSPICQNQTTANLVHGFLKYSSSAFMTNMWKSSYYSVPPCVYHKFSAETTIKMKGKTNFIFFSSKINF
jgi:hypothetical protein